MENFVQAVKATYATTGKSKTTNAFCVLCRNVPMKNVENNIY